MHPQVGVQVVDKLGGGRELLIIRDDQIAILIDYLVVRRKDASTNSFSFSLNADYYTLQSACSRFPPFCNCVSQE